MCITVNRNLMPGGKVSIWQFQAKSTNEKRKSGWLKKPKYTVYLYYR